MNYDGVVHVFVLSFYIILYPQILSARTCVYTVGKGGEADQEAIGRSKGGLSTKIHAVVDALGNPLSFHLTPG